MREQHGGASRFGMATVVVAVALLLPLLFSSTAAANAGGPISGQTTVGETLTASPAHFYQWQRCDPTQDGCASSGVLWFLDPGWSVIPGHSGTSENTYTLTQSDLGMKIRVVSNDIFNGPLIGSPPVGPVTGASAPVNTGLPSIDGTPSEGSTLTADDGSWQSQVAFTTSRQWLRSDGSGGFEPIPGATGHSYDLTADDVGHTIAVQVVANNSGGDSAPATSAAVGPVVAKVPVNTDAPTISGDAIKGSTLTADDGSWQSSDQFTTSRQWLRSNGDGYDEILGATGQTYTLTADDVGHEIAVRVVATNSGGDSDPATSAPTSTVIYPQPTNVGRPSIAGDPIVGQTLTGDDGTWQGDDLTFARQWQRSNGDGYDDIPGAEGATYKLTAADMNRRIRLRVVASGPGGESDPAFSAPTDPVVNPPVFGQSGNLDPVSGTVLARLPGSSEIQDITELTNVPMGTTVDVTGGFVDLITQKSPDDKLQTETLWDGAFVVGQRNKGLITVLKLTDSIVGPNATRSGGGAQIAAKGKRRLWGRGHCRCRTRGRNSSGTARGTFWLTAERKRGTFTKVKEGKVLVRDFTQNKKVLVNAGEHYLAPSH
jgi:hypothetical protein